LLWLKRARILKNLSRGRAILRVLYLFAHCGEKFSDSYFADLIGNEGQNGTAAIGLNGIGRARFVLAVRFE
jgi:hypothetical protein